MFFVSAFVGTTLAYRPYGGPFGGPLGDITPTVGFGYLASQRIALELDVGATWTRDGYVATGLTPGIVWSFHPNVYAAGRFIVFVHPELNLALYPGLGGTFAIGALSPFAELNLISTFGRGEPDLGLTLSAGASYAF
jgi:hypothetical protein